MHGEGVYCSARDILKGERLAILVHTWHHLPNATPVEAPLWDACLGGGRAAPSIMALMALTWGSDSWVRGTPSRGTRIGERLVRRTLAFQPFSGSSNPGRQHIRWRRLCQAT